MKYISLIILNLIFFQSYSQKNKEEVLKKNKVKEIIITACEFKKGQLFKKVMTEDFIDKYGKSYDLIKYKENGEEDSRILTYHQNIGDISIDTIKDGNNKLKYIKIISKDSINRITKSLVINDKKDTLDYDISYKNLKNKDSIIISRCKDKTSYIKRKWFYDKSPEFTLIESYYENRKTSYRNEYNYKQIDNNCKLYFDSNNQENRKVCVQNGNKTTYFIKHNTGFLYGIRVIYAEGGREETINNKNGLLESMSCYDRNNVKLSEISFSYKIE